MKTTVKTVTVEITDNGKRKYLTFSIATKDGDLMTNRLKKLLAGKISYCGNIWRDGHGIFVDPIRDVHFVGMVWRPPYQLLQELIADRIQLQRELYKLEGKSELTNIQGVVTPKTVTSDVITEFVLDEIRTRELVKKRIRELDRIKDIKDAKLIGEVSRSICVNWESTSDTVPRPYSW